MDKFLSRFNYTHVTYQVFKSGKPIRVEYLPATQAIQAQENEEIFFMVNQGDGIIHDGFKTCRSQKSVTTLKACFLDVDQVPFKQVKEYLSAIQLRPHIVVETSPKKYHIYFLLEDEEATPKNIRTWKLIQETLSKLGTDKPLTDPTMTDHSRVLRLPGFKHLKDPQNPFTVKVVFTSEHAKFMLNELADQLSIDSSNQPEKFAFRMSDGPVRTGSRHQDLTSLGGHLLSHGLPQDTVKELLRDRAVARYPNGKEFLAGGTRGEEIEKFVSYAFNKYLEKHTSTIADIDSPPTKEDPFQLDDQFFFDCPSIAGEITKEICSKAFISNPPFSFASNAAILGMLKGNTTSSLGHSPSNYFLCLGPTGSGKNYPQEVYSLTLAQLGLSSFVDLKLRSEKGVLRLLQDHSSALVMSDEAEYFLSSLDDRFAPPYIRACKPLLLDLYTATNKVFNFGRTGEEAQVEILKPRLSYVGYGVLTALEQAFSIKSIQDGLLQRFIIVTDFRPVYRNPNAQPPQALNGHHIDALKQLRSRLTQATEDELGALADLELDYEIAKSEKKRDRIKEIKEQIRILKAKIRTSEPTTVKVSPSAAKLLQSYSDTLIQRRNDDQDSGAAGLWTRGAEQAGRLCVALAANQEDISETLATWCIDFIDSRLNALHLMCQESLLKGPQAKEGDKFLFKIAELSRKQNNQPVTKRDLMHALPKTSRKDYQEIIMYLSDLGRIEILKNYRIGERGRKGEAYILDDLSS